MRTTLFPSFVVGVGTFFGVLALCTALPTPSEAALVLTIDDLGTAGIDVIVADNSPVGTPTAKGLSTVADDFPTAGAVQFSGI